MREIKIPLDWRAYAVLEGATKIASALVQKSIGDRLHTFGLGVTVSAVVGAVQAAGSVLWLSRYPHKERHALLIPNYAAWWWMLGAGAGIALFGTVLSIYTFALGAELGPRTLIVNSLLIWTAIAGFLVWKDPLGWRQWSGMALYVLCIWAMVDFQPLDALLELPLWLFVSLAVALGNAWNYVCLRKAKDRGLTDPFAQSYWVGVWTATFCWLSAIIAYMLGDESVAAGTPELAALSALLGIIAIGVIAFIALANVGGATTGLQNAIMQAVYLVGMWLIGMAFFDDPFTWERLGGAMVFFPAVLLIGGGRKR